MESPGRNVSISYDDIHSLDESGDDDFILPTLYHRNDAGIDIIRLTHSSIHSLIHSLTNRLTRSLAQPLTH